MTDVEKYIFSFPEDVRDILLQIRQIVREEAPDAVEGFAYHMPSYKTNGKPLIYFAGFKKHIGFYPTPTGHIAFASELSNYKQGKGSVQFPLNVPIPFELIRQIVAFRVEENKYK